MNRVTGSDRPTAGERASACDCLVEIVKHWLTQPIPTGTPEARAAQLGEVCLWVSQMRHRMPSVMEIERCRWLERVAMRVCAQTPGGAGHEPLVVQNLKAQTTVAMLTYHDWREQYAPVVRTGVRRITS